MEASVLSELTTVTQQLVEVRSAITACLKAQEYGTGDKRKRMADLSQLRDQEKYLLDRKATLEKAASSNTGTMNTVLAKRG